MSYLDQASTVEGFPVFKPSAKDDSFYLDPNFFNQVFLHICKNQIDYLSPPLLFAIQGKKGEGKTESIKQICASLGIYVVWLHGSSVSGEHEKEPVKLIESAYIQAASYYKLGKKAVVLIDDIDTSVASMVQERRYTVNSQLVNGRLMSLADNPNKIGKVDVQRIPIFLTGNNLKNLYSPLTRSGRMRIFTWKPSLEIKINIVYSLFENSLSNGLSQNFKNFVIKFGNEPVSFFKDLREELWDDVILSIVNKSGSINFSSINEELKNIKLQIDVEQLFELAKIKQENKIEDFT